MMTGLEEVWQQIYNNQSCTIRVKTRNLDNIKRQLSKYKYQKMKEVGELNAGRLKTQVLKEVEGIVFLKIWLDFGEEGRSVELEIIEVEPMQDEDGDGEDWEEVTPQ